MDRVEEVALEYCCASSELEERLSLVRGLVAGRMRVIRASVSGQKLTQVLVASVAEGVYRYLRDVVREEHLTTDGYLEGLLRGVDVVVEEKHGESGVLSVGVWEATYANARRNWARSVGRSVA